MAKKLRRNNESYQLIKVEKAKHKKALMETNTYRFKRHQLLEVIANMRFVPHFGNLKLIIKNL